MNIFAPAKLTVSLRITGVRADGYHLIDAEMVTLNFGDDIKIEPAPTTSVSVIDSRTGNEMVLSGENLVTKALELLNLTAKVQIEKRIPPGAGLGGGSADAAAVLRAAGFTDYEKASQLGADVSFCLRGGRARVSGIGEVIEPLPELFRNWTLQTPPFGCATADVYKKWDELGAPRGENENDLEPAAMMVEPRLAKWRAELESFTKQKARLAGSGSTWFVAGEFAGEGRVVATEIGPEENLTAN